MKGQHMDPASNGKAGGKIHEVVILVYPGLTLLDAIGPNEVLSNSDRFNVTFASKDGADVFNDHGNLSLSKLRSIKEIHQADILLVPGGPGDVSVMEDEEVLRWIVEMDRTTIHTTSVCTGALILARAGLLKGRKACTYWAYLPMLRELGALPVRRRFVADGKYVTAASVSAGIDMALFLLGRMTGAYHAKEMQYGIEYFPNRHDLLSPYTLPLFWQERLAKRTRAVINANRDRIRKRLREGAPGK